MPEATKFTRLQVGEHTKSGSETTFADVLQSQRVNVSAASTAAGAPGLIVIAGDFEVDTVYFTSPDPAVSASTINIGTPASATRFGTFALIGSSAGGVSGRLALTANTDWLTTGSVLALTTVQALVSGSAPPVSAGVGTLVFNYYVRDVDRSP